MTDAGTAWTVGASPREARMVMKQVHGLMSVGAGLALAGAIIAVTGTPILIAAEDVACIAAGLVATFLIAIGMVAVVDGGKG